MILVSLSIIMIICAGLGFWGFFLHFSKDVVAHGYKSQ